jgi:hypothetical protein
MRTRVLVAVIVLRKYILLLLPFSLSTGYAPGNERKKNGVWWTDLIPGTDNECPGLALGMHL